MYSSIHSLFMVLSRLIAVRRKLEGLGVVIFILATKVWKIVEL
jgi:hypothetical protein